MLVHLAFVAFVVLGGLLAIRWPRVVGVHLATVAWGVVVELAGLTCPLTPLENWLRERAGDAPYTGDFVDRCVLPVLYPEGLRRDTQVGLAALVVLVNLLVYGYLLRRRPRAPWFRPARPR